MLLPMKHNMVITLTTEVRKFLFLICVKTLSCCCYAICKLWTCVRCYILCSKAFHFVSRIWIFILCVYVWKNYLLTWMQTTRNEVSFEIFTVWKFKSCPGLWHQEDLDVPAFWGKLIPPYSSENMFAWKYKCGFWCLVYDTKPLHMYLPNFRETYHLDRHFNMRFHCVVNVVQNLLCCDSIYSDGCIPEFHRNLLPYSIISQMATIKTINKHFHVHLPTISFNILCYKRYFCLSFALCNVYIHGSIKYIMTIT